MNQHKNPAWWTPPPPATNRSFLPPRTMTNRPPVLRPNVFTNKFVNFTNHAPVFTNHPPISLLPG